MGKPVPPVVKRPLFYWVFAKYGKLQILLLLIIFVTVFARVLPLEMQKRIVNESIKLRKFDLLLTYCGIYLAAVVCASLLKYLINVLQTLISQRTLADMRKELYEHIITLPLDFYRKTQPGMVVASLVTELTTSANFAGMAVSAPIINLLTLLAFAGYLIWLNPMLGAISLAIYPLVIFLVPILQKRANRANKKRIDLTRTMSSAIGESITGIHEIHGNGSYKLEGEKFNSLVNRLYKVRLVWAMLLDGVKVTNNFIVNLGPFFIFLLGGYLAMKGRLELGALVAFLSAQEKLYDPWKELIEFYQVYQDASVNYARTMEYFDEAPQHELVPVDRKPLKLDPSLSVRNLSFEVDGGIQLLDDINFNLEPGRHMALVGFSGSGKSTLALCIAQLYKYTGGSIQIGDAEVAQITKKDMTHNIGFVSQAPFIFSGTIEENLSYSSRAMLNGNEDGAKAPTLDDMISVLQQTGLFIDVLRFGLSALLSDTKNQEIVSALIRVRKSFQEEFGESLSEYVEFFDENKYLVHSSVAENILFGAAVDPDFFPENLADNPAFISFLVDAELKRPLLSLGSQLARQTVDILGDMPREAVFFEQSPISPEELDDYKALVDQLRKKRLHELSEGQNRRLLDLALRFSPGRHKMVALPDILRTLILEGRSLFRERILEEESAAVTFFRESEYIHSQSILNNILFGKLKTDSQNAQEQINQNVIQLLIEEDFLEKIVQIGMQFQVGSKGDRLSGGQRQKLAIARTFLKAPRLLIMDEATSALDNKSQARIQNLLETRFKGRSTLISVVHRLDIVKNYDQIAVMKAGKIVEMGSYDELMEKKGILYELISGKR